MATNPTHDQLAEALAAAASAHHDFEKNALNGLPDEQWPGWYAAYVLGRLGDFTTPTTLAGWLKNVSADSDWAAAAAQHVASRLD